MPHRALLLVDLQNDFCAGGALAVPEGDSTVEVANRLIDWCQSRGEAVIASQDWHPANHGSFASQHGVEPYTPGQLDGCHKPSGQITVCRTVKAHNYIRY
ncbi:nicotinamidase/pyrazinamidase [Escherichia coli]|nr:nicotinamidase/pyrazinamidase [Escherichia coli]